MRDKTAALLTATMATALAMPAMARIVERSIPRSTDTTNRYRSLEKPHQGSRERTRRLRQIEKAKGGV